MSRGRLSYTTPWDTIPKLAARHLAGLWKPSKSLSELIDQELANPDVHQLNSPRHTITVDDMAFRKRLEAELNRAQHIAVKTSYPAKALAAAE